MKIASPKMKSWLRLWCYFENIFHNNSLQNLFSRFVVFSASFKQLQVFMLKIRRRFVFHNLSAFIS